MTSEKVKNKPKTLIYAAFGRLPSSAASAHPRLRPPPPAPRKRPRTSARSSLGLVMRCSRALSSAANLQGPHAAIGDRLVVRTKDERTIPARVVRFPPAADSSRRSTSAHAIRLRRRSSPTTAPRPPTSTPSPPASARSEAGRGDHGSVDAWSHLWKSPALRPGTATPLRARNDPSPTPHDRIAPPAMGSRTARAAPGTRRWTASMARRRFTPGQALARTLPCLSCGSAFARPRPDPDHHALRPPPAAQQGRPRAFRGVCRGSPMHQLSTSFARVDRVGTRRGRPAPGGEQC